MTDRLNGLTVTFEHDTREDDAEPIIAAIRLLRGVGSVVPVVADVEAHLAREQVRLELRKQLWDVLHAS